MRKNLRGFLAHAQRLADSTAHAEFPDLKAVWVSPSLLEEGTLAFWYQEANMIFLNVHCASLRKLWLDMNDEKLTEILRHELLHGELHRLEKPSGDNDPEFILECLRRKVPVNLPSIAALEEKYGKGSFAMFRDFLPPPDVEVIPLAEGSGGVLLKEKWE